MDAGGPRKDSTARRLERAVVAAMLAVTALWATTPLLCYDIWWHMATGRLVWEQGVPRIEPFGEFIAGSPYRLCYGLGDVPLYLLYRLGGIDALIAAKVLFVTALAGALWCWKGRALPAAIACPLLLLGVVAMAERMYVRPELYSWALAVALAAVLERSLQRPAWGWAVPVVFALWGNLHLGWPLGAMMVAVFWAAQALSLALGRSEEIRDWTALLRRAWPAALSPLALCVNPYGVLALSAPWRSAASTAAQAHIIEWQAWWVHPMGPPVYRYAYFAMLAGTAILLFVARRHVRWHWIGWFVLAAALSLDARRLMALVGLLGAPAALHALAAGFPSLQTRPRKVRPAALALVLIVGFGALRAAGYFIDPAKSLRFAETGIYSETVPLAECDFLRRHRLPTPLLNSFGHGGAAIWELYPDYRVFIDSRQAPYPDDFLQEYFQLMQAPPDWEAVLARRGIRTLLLPLEERALAAAAWHSPRWTLVWAGNSALVFVRRDPDTAALCDSLRYPLDELVARIDWTRYDRASRWYRRRPYPMPMLRLAELCRLFGRTDVTLELYRDICRRRPDCLPAALNRIRYEIEAGNATEAVALARGVIVRGGEAWGLLAEAYRLLGDPDAAALAERRKLPPK